MSGENDFKNELSVTGMKDENSGCADTPELTDELVANVLASSVWSVAPVDEEPEIVLKDWTVFEVTSSFWPDKTRHFVGYNSLDREGRVSSAIIQFDAEKATGITKSGRVYRLLGKQGTGSPDGLHVWNYWCRKCDVTKSEEIKLG